MVHKQLLKKIFLLQDLPDHVIEKIGEISDIQTYDTNDVLYSQDEFQTIFYMLLSGKVLLNSTSNSGFSMTLDTVLPGRIFGVSSVLSEPRGAFTAVCSEPCKLIAASGKQMRLLFTQDFEIGHIVMRKMVEMYKHRRDLHTQQFLDSLKTHSEIKKLQASPAGEEIVSE
jgi:CRP/FNR family cyclic AMP-dependent transcriptional regulator